MAAGEVLRHHAAVGQAGEVALFDAEVVEQCGGVVGLLRQRVAVLHPPLALALALEIEADQLEARLQQGRHQRPGGGAHG
ncbi:hypothetical protein D3C72_2176840 [compost metagenome]